jgi:hypothetical protein
MKPTYKLQENQHNYTKFVYTKEIITVESIRANTSSILGLYNF